jgi:RNA polymerase sigma factor (sigma-70 family)
MKDSRAHGGARDFPETEWSQLLALGDSRHPDRTRNLDRLLRRYWAPIFHYLRAVRRLNDQDAADATQSFFTMVIESLDFSSLSPDRGSFRTFLKVVLRRYLLRQERGLHALVRRSEVSLPSDDLAGDLPLEAAEDAETAFERAWAATVLREADERLRDQLYRIGKKKYYEVFRDYCLQSEEDTYETIAARHGLKVTDVRNYLHSVRQLGRVIVRQTVEQYLLPGEDVERELRHLLDGGA